MVRIRTHMHTQTRTPTPILNRMCTAQAVITITVMGMHPTTARMHTDLSSLLQLIWLASPALPIGGFSYSQKLKNAVPE